MKTEEIYNEIQKQNVEKYLFKNGEKILDKMFDSLKTKCYAALRIAIYNKENYHINLTPSVVKGEMFCSEHEKYYIKSMGKLWNYVNLNDIVNFITKRYKNKINHFIKEINKQSEFNEKYIKQEKMLDDIRTDFE